jgi:DNA polymerase III subunit epsilon
MYKRPLVFFDVETTGLNPQSDRIIEVGIVRVKNDKVTNEYSSLVNPEIPIESIIHKLTGITDLELSSAPKFSDIYTEIQKILDETIIVAHNAIFDISFLANEFGRLKIYENMNYICSLQTSRKLYSNFAKHNLSAIVDRLHLDSGSRHRALSDARVLHQFFKIIKEERKKERFEHIIEYLIKDFKFQQ